MTRPSVDRSDDAANLFKRLKDFATQRVIMRRRTLR
jgi:hypothetical protein